MDHPGAYRPGTWSVNPGRPDFMRSSIGIHSKSSEKKVKHMLVMLDMDELCHTNGKLNTNEHRIHMTSLDLS